MVGYGFEPKSRLDQHAAEERLGVSPQFEALHDAPVIEAEAGCARNHLVVAEPLEKAIAYASDGGEQQRRLL
jgi:hypothetical protein